MPQWFIELFSVVANGATVLGIVVAIYVLRQVRQISQRLELVIAPKVGIEGFLNLCAQIVESDPDGTCVSADDGLIVLVNKRMEEISGYHRSELIGQPIEILVPASVRAIHPRHRETYLTRSSNRPMRGLSLRHKRGEEIPAGIWLGHFSDASGGYTIAKVRVSEG